MITSGLVLRRGLLERLRAARAELLSAIDGLDEQQMAEPALGGWSVKDHLAHIGGGPIHE